MTTKVNDTFRSPQNIESLQNYIRSEKDRIESDSIGVRIYAICVDIGLDFGTVKKALQQEYPFTPVFGCFYEQVYGDLIHLDIQCYRD